MEKRVLIITGAAPPSSGSHATRVAAVVEGFHAARMNVTVITIRVSSVENSESTLFRRMNAISRVVQTGGGAFRAAAEYLGDPGKRKRNFGKYIQYLRIHTRKFMFPDTFVTWIPGAVRESLRQIKLTGADIIISSGAPFSSHIAAFLVSKLSGVPLALDYGDPWVYEPGRPRAGLRLIVERALEKTILSHAKIVSLTTLSTIKLYRTMFPEISQQYYLLPMGFDRSDYRMATTKFDKKDKRKTTFVYAGRINEEYRTIAGLLDILELYSNDKLSIDVEFVFYGSEFSSIQKELSKFLSMGLVKLCGNLEHEKYIRALMDADGLMIFGNNNNVQIPGKVAHFLPARKPILYFCNIEDVHDDPAYALLQSVQLSHIYLARTISDYFSFRKSCVEQLSPIIDEAALAELDWAVSCEKYAEKIGEIMCNSE